MERDVVMSRTHFPSPQQASANVRLNGASSHGSTNDAMQRSREEDYMELCILVQCAALQCLVLVLFLRKTGDKRDVNALPRRSNGEFSKSHAKVTSSNSTLPRSRSAQISPSMTPCT